MIVTTLIAALGIGLAAFRYARGANVPDPEKSKNPFYKASLGKFYVDEFYDALVVIFCALSELLHWGFDQLLIDGLIGLTAELVRSFSGLLRRIQTGVLNTYAFAILGGTVAFLIYLFMSSH